MKKLETVRKLVRQTTAQGESSNLKEQLQTEELLQQVEEMKVALEGVNQQFRENQKLRTNSLKSMQSMIENQEILQREMQEVQKEILEFRESRDTGNWILRIVYFGLIIVVGINLGMLVGILLS